MTGELSRVLLGGVTLARGDETIGRVIDSELLDIIVCPSCHQPLAVLEGGQELGCTGCDLAYPITDGIPVLLIDEARHRG